MSAVEEIEAAIERLERFARFNEKWVEHYSVTGDDGSSSIKTDDGRVPIEAIVPEYADLVTMLHRTIDAQLAILREARMIFVHEVNRSVWQSPSTSRTDHAALDLARAINGTA